MPRKLGAAEARRAAFWLAAFGPIAMLLGHVQPVARMSLLAWIVGLPSCLVMAAMALWAWRAGDEDFLLRLRAGLVGGLVGTLCYDAIRIPMHLLGQNPFVPLRAYGVWIAAAPRASLGTDLLGLAYQFSNGITFAWIYSIPLLRRHWAWGVIWGLALETISILTAFGQVFAIRYNPVAATIAYVAHLFYGYPLGRACRRPEEWLGSILPLARRERGLATLIGFALFAVWFVQAFEPLGARPALAPGEIAIGPDAIESGWTEAVAGGEIRLVNQMGEPVELSARDPSDPAAPRRVALGAGETMSLALPERGVCQIWAPSKPGWRSAFIAAQDRGNYRPPPAPSR